MVIGMILAGLAFVVAGFVQLKVQTSQQILKSGESKLMIYNSAVSFSYDLEGVNGYGAMNQTLNNGEVSNIVFACAWHTCTS